MRGQLSMIDELLPSPHCLPAECAACHPWGRGVPNKSRCEAFGSYPDGKWFSVVSGAKCCRRGGPPPETTEEES